MGHVTSVLCAPLCLPALPLPLILMHMSLSLALFCARLSPKPNPVCLFLKTKTSNPPSLIHAPTDFVLCMEAGSFACLEGTPTAALHHSPSPFEFSSEFWSFAHPCTDPLPPLPCCPFFQLFGGIPFPTSAAAADGAVPHSGLLTSAKQGLNPLPVA